MAARPGPVLDVSQRSIQHPEGWRAGGTEVTRGLSGGTW
eukprot:CAMPEP_0174325518 /NCGR_PEP_ID=MMETSP0810-20121108/13296_1 /TAXON_ID=73025 ORGANISM="Eutreptiella gymnastica-like, Strain CCMP1594" /NCGR_SAMPLE_ID=MMETSP0810 /ASSEMBLY_ACC=CAM_ASM_000659 /LENGTH=38 /DNA_ID= /DNA_START= /DNA_END= /DNA_ORIENTATION=